MYLSLSYKVKSDQIHQCKDHNITITDEDLEGMEKCVQAIELKSLNEMTMAKLPCFTKCMMDSFGMVRESLRIYWSHNLF